MAIEFESGTTISINKICTHNPQLHFYINDYQRGYRWTKYESQKLLEDLYAFYKENPSNKTFYCLQPLIVARRTIDGIEKLEVLDGQQRLTTIYILMKNLHDNPQYTIEYKTRKGSEDFLNNLGTNESEADKNIDFFHMQDVFSNIQIFLSTLGDSGFQEFIKSGERIKFIWYDVTEQIKKDPQSDSDIDNKKIRAIFSRLNAGKIALTDAELIKALLIHLTRNNDSEKETVLKREKLAAKWDAIENKMNDPDFWGFLYGKDDERYATHIEFLLDVLSKEERAYDYYDSRIKKESAETLWKEITDLYDRYNNWYSDKNLYHLIGFLRYCNVDIRKIDKIYEFAQSHSDFIRLLELFSKSCAISNGKELKEIVQSIDDEANNHQVFRDKVKKFSREAKGELSTILDKEDISYTNNKDGVKKLLLLLNLLTVAQQKNEMRLSFANFYSQSYDLEHVSSQTPPDTDDEKVIKEWAMHQLEFLTGIEYSKSPKDEEYLKEVDTYLSQKKNKLACETIKAIEELMKCAKDAQEYKMRSIDIIDDTKLALGMKKDSKTFSGDKLQNLVLLDTNTNRSYGNAFFPVKRAKIFEQEMENGIYILPCTKNVFNKVYNKQLNDLMEWTEDDAESYLKAMEAIWEKALT